MKEWCTRAELAALDLTGFPKTESGVIRWFKKHGLAERFPTKVRERSGKGGGLEFHISLLPRPVRNELNIRHLKSAEAPPEPELFDGAHDIPEPIHSQAGELRRDASLLILSFWDIYKSRSTLPLESTRHSFAALYNNGKLEGVPDWVRKARPSFHPNTLRAWEGLRDEGRFSELAGNYGNRKGSGVLATAEGGRIETFIAARIVNQPHLTADHIRDLVRAEFGDEVDVRGKARPLPPIRTFQRFITAWKAGHQEAYMRMTDPDGFKNKKRVTGRNMNAWVSRPNQLWEIDASPADVLLVDGRYSIYALVDIHTRRMAVTVSRTAKTQAVHLLIRKAILKWGVPEVLRTDNGSDFISFEFKRALTALAIHQDITDPFSPEQKGTVERHIGTLQRGLMPLLPGFIGHSVADRKKIEARKSFARRLGESDKDAFCVELTAVELQAVIDDWLAAKYEHRAHAGLNGKTPFEVTAAWDGPIRKIADERALDVLLAPIAGKDGLRTVTKNGIRLDRAYFLHPDMVPGTTVLCRHDPEDMGRIYVFSEDGRRFLYAATCPERVGINPGDAVRAVREMQKQRLTAELEPLRRDIKRMKPRDAIDDVLRVNQADHDSLVAFPQKSESYTTPHIDAATSAAGRHDTPDQVLSAQIADRQAALADELSRPAEVIPVDDRASRFRRARAIEKQIAAGTEVPAADRTWLAGYVNTPEYRAQRAMEEDFEGAAQQIG